ncbi:uncharacterized protein J7T54_007348 [Emericellopsis cladophorae]|uniref:ER-bound oxygenase mpaB/mpaB'/Rubber oxygenase catalytic domain-containing protein n=1 Tax=Emericellopsis cladophorae TaxID=2686198 RepID=A0A9P9XZM0_9HYPO|nr:uncharacterized protein J7T54_007348 [Emericellopsis cladophorae]KAI6780868.1 hypothetical protein J7T54_007348 [Emericellopsis cladophorae]
MACPIDSGAEMRKRIEKPHIYEPVAEPNELKSVVIEGIYLMGGQFAILCQFAHPGLAEGSFKHSNFAYRIMNRLKTTARFLNAAVFGTRAEQEAIFGVIHAAHKNIKGEGYYADDPELHKWTAATLFVAIIVVHEAFFGKVSRERQEVLYRESSVYGTSLRMPPEMWPATLDDFWAYWHHNINTLEVTNWARKLGTDLLWPKAMPLWALPNIPIARLMTIHWLPERLRGEYGFKTTALSTGLYYCVSYYIAFWYPMLPRAVREYPSRYYIQDMKKAVERIERTGTWYERGKM